MKELTKKQNEVLTFVKKFMATHNYPPTVREIGANLGLSSPATIQSHMNALEAKGVIKKNGSKNRAYELLVENEFENKRESVIKVPLLGTVTCGSPIEAIEKPNEFIDLPSYLIPLNHNVFTLKTSGESMINKGIYDGDIVIIERVNNCNNGDIVCAMTSENEVTLKTFYKEKDHIRLQPENDYMEPLIFDNVTVLGKAIGLYRKL